MKAITAKNIMTMVAVSAVSLLILKTLLADAHPKEAELLSQQELKQFMVSEVKALSASLPVVDDAVVWQSISMVNDHTALYDYQAKELDYAEFAYRLKQQPFMAYDLCISILDHEDTALALKSGATFIHRFKGAGGETAVEYALDKAECGMT